MRVDALSLTSLRSVSGWILLFGLAKLSLHLATTSGYGYFRDELYYLACANHPALGFVDHPPLSILFLWIVRHALGTSLLALRLLPALLGAAMVMLVGVMAPAYTWLFAAGGVAIEALFASPRLARMPDLMVELLLLAGAILAPLALPILSVDRSIRYAQALGEQPSTEERKELGDLGQFYADMQGWERIVDTLVDVNHGLSITERGDARILAPDYGVAGAIDLFGGARGLPAAISGHNNYWLWGPRDWNGRVLIVVGGGEENLRARFDEVERAATIDCGRCMPYENGRPVWVCRGLHGSVEGVWERIKHYD